MAYRKRKWKQTRSSRPHRYGEYIKKLHLEIETKKSNQKLVNILAYWRDKKSQETWDNALPILAEFKEELNNLGNVPSSNKPVEVLQFCVNLFEITSRYQDKLKDKLLCAPEDKQDAFFSFQNNIYFCGRHTVKDLREDPTYGKLPFWNTTMPGQAITMDTIYFGPELGLPRKPASYWVSLSKKKKINIASVTEYAKGTLVKKISVWETEAIVKAGVHKFCKAAIEKLSINLEELLAC